MTEQKFQVGDKVQVEGMVTFVADRGELWVDGSYVDRAKVTLVERPVKPLTPGTVVQHKHGSRWVVIRDELVVYVVDGVTGLPIRSGHSAATLARAVANHPNDHIITYTPKESE